MNHELDNQKDYWNRVADTKTFTHPLDIVLFDQYVNKTSQILDYGCGYGRLVKRLKESGYQNVIGYDSSEKMIERGQAGEELPLYPIDQPFDLMVDDLTVDCILLFAVLTCIPTNQGQTRLIELLKNKLRSNGLLYVSDYYLQINAIEMEQYETFNDDMDNHGVFALPEGVTFRHHTRQWILTLFKEFKIESEQEIEVQTMNGGEAKAFQLMLRKK